MNNILNPQIGQFVKVAQGRDASKLAVIVGLEPERFVFIADGDKRKFEQPKRKNLLHLELQKDISREVVQSLNESGRVTNSKLRYVIQKYAEQLNEANAE